jgi:ABC-type multidrug transport system fused ATPase/permease subunit
MSLLSHNSRDLTESLMTAFLHLRKFVRQNVLLSVLYFVLLLVSPANSVVSPVLIGRLSSSIMKQNKRKIILNMSLLVLMNVFVLAVYNIELVVGNYTMGSLAICVRRKLIEKFFETHDTLTDSALEGQVSLNTRVYITALIDFINLSLGMIFPKFMSLFFQATHLFIRVDRVLALLMIGVLVVCIMSIVHAVYIGSFNRSMKTVIELEAVDDLAIDDILDNFAYVALAKRGVEKEIQRLERTTKRRIKTRVRAAVSAIISGVAPVNGVVALIGCGFIYRFFKLFIGSNSSSSSNEQRLTQGVTVASMFFDMINIVRSITHQLFTISEEVYTIHAAHVAIFGQHISSLTVEEDEKDNDEKDSVRCRRRPRLLLSSPVAVELDNVCYAYPKGNNPFFSGGACQSVFYNFSLTIPKETLSVIVGPNGCGKTTLFRILLNFAEPQSGKVKIFGNAYNSCQRSKTNQIRERIAYSDQRAILLNRTVFENITYRISRKKKCSKTAVEKKLKSAGLTEFFDALPNGLDTVVGPRGERLSGGQRQVIQITRILLDDNAKLVLLDEVTAAMDTEHKNLVMSIITGAAFKKKTVILITHDPDLISQSNQVIDLSNCGG